MTPSAIHQAIRLSKYPEEMAWICQSSAVLPVGVTELLRLCSSHENILSFAEKNHTDAEPLQQILLNFVEKVLLNMNNTDEKILGIGDESDADLCKLHYQLLIKIVHPDRNPSKNADEQTARITKAYQAIKNQTTTSEYKNIRISRVPPKSFYQATSKAEQEISNVRGASIATLVITLIAAVWIGGYFYKPNSHELFSKNTLEIQQTTEEILRKDFFNQSQDAQFAMAKHADAVDTASKQDQFQRLLTSVEIAYENGNAAKIQTILNSPEIKQQSDKEVLTKLKNLFQITSDRKMLLYDFEWKNISGQITGKGKFLSRYHLNGDKQWLTREGVASIIATESDSLLNITSLKLDNKNIDQ